MNKSYLNSEINIALSAKLSRKIQLWMMVLFVLLFGNTVFGQSVGDYRSVATGDWKTLSSWQYYNGSTWVTPSGTSPQGYPGQFTGTGAVLIQSGHTIAVQNTGITTLAMGTVTISGTLDLIGKSSSQVNFSFNTNNMIVLSGGTIKFNDKSKLSLPANANLQVTTGGLTGDCSNNQDIFIGSSQYAVCVGSGSILDFTQVMAGGGTLNTTISSNSPICENGTINLVGGISNTGWTIVSYSWSIVPPSGATITASTQNVSITNALSGTYAASLTVTAKYGSTNNYTNTETSNVIVNSKPTIPTITAGGSTTFCTGGSVTLTSSAGTDYLWSTGATTQSISPTTAGSYTVQVTNAAGCQSASSAATVVTVNPNLPASVSIVASPSGAISSGTLVTFTATPTNGGTTPSYQWKLNGGDVGTNSNTYTNASFVNGDIVTCVMTSNATPCLTGSPATSNAITMTLVVVAPLTPTVTITNPTCSTPTGQITINSPAPAAKYTYTVVGTSPIVTAVTNTTGIFSGLTAGDYNVIVNDLVTGLSSSGTTATISSMTTKTWTGTWSPAGAPTSSDLVVIDANYSASSDGDLNACSLVINSGHILTVEAGKFIIIQNDLTVNGTLNVLDKGSLVMVNDAGVVTNTGTTNVLRTTTPYRKNDYTYWSTPVASTNIPTRFTGWKTSYAFGYDPTKFFDGPDADSNDDNGDDWVRVTAMTPAKGYAVMGLSATPTKISTISFNGKVNNGVQKITGVIPDGYYLIGNPYPSAIDADDFISDNAGVIDGTLYFWTHNTAIQLASGIAASKAGTGVYAFTSDDYASYNGVGGVGSAAAISGGVIPSGRIASCQGFFAKTNATIVGANEIVFNNGMRLGSGGATLNNLDFFKTKKPKGTIEKHRIWLNLSNEKGAFKQTLIGYVTGATNDRDNRFDGETMDGNQFIDFYSINQDKNLVIQGRALPFDENDEVPLGYRTIIDGSFSIKIEQVDGILTNQDVFIEDKLTNTEFDLKSGNYTFTTAKGTFNNRFVLKYKKTDKTLGTGDLEVHANEVQVSVNNKQIKINSFAETIDNVVVYDVLGREIYQKDNVNSNELSIANLVLSNQALIVKTTLQNGTTTTDKIVY